MKYIIFDTTGKNVRAGGFIVEYSDEKPAGARPLFAADGIVFVIVGRQGKLLDSMRTQALIECESRSINKMSLRDISGYAGKARGASKVSKKQLRLL